MLVKLGDSSTSERIQAELDALRAKEKLANEALLKSLVDLRAELDRRYGTLFAP